jgi:hypothetical protein
MENTKIFYTVYNSHRNYIGCSTDKQWAEYARERHDGYIIASGKFIENPEVVKFKRKRLFKRIENIMWLSLAILGLLGFAQNMYFGNITSSIGMIGMSVIFLYVYIREKNRFN